VIQSQKSHHRGFTLVEVMLVMLILVILASFAVMALAPQRAKAKIQTAKAQIGMFRGMIDMYQQDVDSYPSTQSGLEALRRQPSDVSSSNKWSGPYISTEVPLDPWGRPYQYLAPGKNNPDFDIWSMGPDGQSGTADDIGNWQ
jgi:general secretion pathway protein G